MSRDQVAIDAAVDECRAIAKNDVLPVVLRFVDELLSRGVPPRLVRGFAMVLADELLRSPFETALLRAELAVSQAASSAVN
jgi:hypothetical protein